VNDGAVASARAFAPGANVGILSDWVFIIVPENVH